MGILDLLIADKLRKNNLSLLSREASDVIGQEAKPAVVGELGRFGVQLQPEQFGTGLLGNPNNIESQLRARSRLTGAGASPSQISSLLEPFGQPGKPTTFQRNFAQFQQADAPTKQAILDFKRAGGTTVNVGTNLKPPTGFRFTNPDNPQGSTLEPIPGGPATKPTAAQQKKVAAFEGIRGMVNSLQEGLKDGVNPNSLQFATTDLLRKVPVLGGIWSGLNGDANKESQFLTESRNFSNTALQIMRGAQVGPAEQQLFEESLPTSGMTPKQFEDALNTSIRIFNDAMLESTRQLEGGVLGTPDPISSSNLLGGQESREQRLKRLLGK